MSKKKQFGICTICGEPSAMSELTADGLCQDCEGARLDAIFHNLDADFDEIDGKRISEAKHNNANADVLNQMFAYFIRYGHD
jgi:hypothetical protein